MGSCFSSDTSRHDDDSESTAKVVSLRGDLLQYRVPVLVSQVLQGEANTSPNCFLCNSDSLLYDDYIPVLALDDQLQPNQIYFVLPTSKLQFKLSASDMAALAVKASVALQNGSKKGRHRRNKSQISPVLPANQNTLSKDRIVLEGLGAAKSFDKPVSGSDNNIRMSRSGSVRRLQRYTSRRAKLAVRSFRLRLSTIYEGRVA